MDQLEFEWDLSKSNTNHKKHGVTFEEAKSVFKDPHARIIAEKQIKKK